MRRQASHTDSGAETDTILLAVAVSLLGGHTPSIAFRHLFLKKHVGAWSLTQGLTRPPGPCSQFRHTDSGPGPAPRLVLILGLPQLATAAARPESTEKRKPESTARAATEHTVVREGLLHAASVVFRVLIERIRPFRQPESESNWRHSTSS